MTEGIFKGYFNLLCQQFCVPKLHLEKEYLKPLNKTGNGEFNGSFNKLKYQECLQQHSL